MVDQLMEVGWEQRENVDAVEDKTMHPRQEDRAPTLMLSDGYF